MWAVWHLLSYIQINNAAEWILWQYLDALPLRILIVWVYNNTEKSTLAGNLFHAMANISEFSFLNYGLHYDLFFSGIVFAVAAAIVLFLWNLLDLYLGAIARGYWNI